MIDKKQIIKVTIGTTEYQFKLRVNAEQEHIYQVVADRQENIDIHKASYPSFKKHKLTQKIQKDHQHFSEEFWIIANILMTDAFGDALDSNHQAKITLPQNNKTTEEENIIKLGGKTLHKQEFVAGMDEENGSSQSETTIIIDETGNNIKLSYTNNKGTENLTKAQITEIKNAFNYYDKIHNRLAIARSITLLSTFIVAAIEISLAAKLFTLAAIGGGFYLGIPVAYVSLAFTGIAIIGACSWYKNRYQLFQYKEGNINTRPQEQKAAPRVDLESSLSSRL